MAKKIKTHIKLQCSAGQATPAPPVGPALGQHGVNIMEFCKQFNEKTRGREGVILPVVLTVFEDRTFTFIIKSPPAAVLLKQCCGLAKASGTPSRERVGSVTRLQVLEIARTKMVDLNTEDLEAAIRMVAGTARSMGITVTEEAAVS